MASRGSFPHARLHIRPQIECLEDRTLATGDPAPLGFLLTPIPPSTPLAVHTHQHLHILINGQAQVIPANIGVSPVGATPLHTHDATGKIHIESSVAYEFRLQDFFTIWGQPFTSQQLGALHTDTRHRLTMTVNGQPSTDFGSHVLRDEDVIVIRYDEIPAEEIAHTAAQNQTFVAQVYRDLLGREADADGLAYYAGLLDQGLAHRYHVAQGIQESAEYRMKRIQNMYSQYLDRSADTEGLHNFLTLLASGGTLEQIERMLLSSPEYYLHSGGTEEGFLDALYHDTLQRHVDAGGEAFFASMLVDGAGRAQVVATVFASQEYRENQVRNLYVRYLHRAADAAGLSYFSESLRQGNQSADILAILLASEEYLRRTNR